MLFVCVCVCWTVLGTDEKMNEKQTDGKEAQRHICTQSNSSTQRGAGAQKLHMQRAGHRAGTDKGARTTEAGERKKK